MENNDSRIEIRIKHQLEILNIVRKEKTTITDLAANLDLSFTATSKIVDELVQEGLLAYTSKNITPGRGRRAIFVEFNNDSGVVCVVDFASKDVRVILSSLDSTIIAEESISDFSFLTRDVLIKTEEVIKNLLENEKINNRPLLSICVITPGIVRADDFSYVESRILARGDIARVDPVSYLSNAFGVKTEMYNDVKIGCFGELKYGDFPKESFNGLFIHLGSAAGLALIINGKIYRGSNNSSGETAFYNDELDDPVLKESYWNGKFFPMREIYLKICRLNNIEPSYSFDTQKIVDDYHNNEESTVAAVTESAKRNAITIVSLTTILDVEYIVLEGQVLKLGQPYVDLLRKYISLYSVNSIKAKIIISTLKEDCEVLGACYKAADIYLFDKLESFAKKRTRSSKFFIDNSFKEI